jgi:hypothetical protein
VSPACWFRGNSCGLRGSGARAPVLEPMSVQGFCFPCCLGPFLSEFWLLWSDPRASSPTPWPIRLVPGIPVHFGIGSPILDVSPNLGSNRAARSDLALASLDSLVLGMFMVLAQVAPSSPTFFLIDARPCFPFGSCLILTDSDAQGCIKKIASSLSPSHLFLIAWPAGLHGEFILLGRIKFRGVTISLKETFPPP